MHDVALEADGTSYRVVISNSVGSVTSKVVLLGVKPLLEAPHFTTSPTSVSVVVGSAATFNAVAAGTPAPEVVLELHYGVSAASTRKSDHHRRARAASLRVASAL